jgi:hypothetical protein
MTTGKSITSEDYLKRRQEIRILEAEMRNEMQTYKSYWSDLSDFILPRRSRFFITDAKKGDRKNHKIIDSTGTMASRTLQAGFMTGITSPARPWFDLGIPEVRGGMSPEVKLYLKTVTESIRSYLLASNFYSVAPVMYADIGTFATGCIFMEEDLDTGFHFHSFPIGSYMISTDRKGKVSVFQREFQMTVRQIVDTFGRKDDSKEIDWTNISRMVEDLYNRNQLEAKINVAHLIQPNQNYNPRKLESKYKKYESLYYEIGLESESRLQSNTFESDKFLSEKGYDYFPVLAPRWEVVGEDTYGTQSPGMVALGDIKQLQQQEKRIAEALNQKVRPSMVGPTSLRNQKTSILPGDITYTDEREGMKGFRRLFDLDFDIRELEGKQQQLRERISKAYFEDLFLMLANSDRRQITAREIEERHEEKLLALGPVLERLNQDFLDPLIDNAFLILNEQGRLPDPPEELLDAEYTVEYISIMAQAQKLAGIGNIERFMGYVGQVASFDPEALAKVDVEKSIELYGELTSIDPEIIRSEEEVMEIREAQAQQQQQQEQMAGMQELANTGKTLSETDMDTNNALTQLIGGI